MKIKSIMVQKLHYLLILFIYILEEFAKGPRDRRSRGPQPDDICYNC